MVDLTNPEYQQLFLNLVHFKFEVDEEKNTITTGGVEFDRGNPDVQYIIDKAIEASKEMTVIMQKHYEKMFEPEGRLVH